MTEFDFLPNALLGSDGQLTDAASDTARRGEVIFNRTYKGLGNRSCASCHVPDGNFLDRQAHNIGSVEQPYQGARTGALDTPTLLGIAHTAPYFHDGSLPTLLVAIGSAVRADDWVLAQAHWFEFQTEAQAIKEKAF